MNIKALSGLRTLVVGAGQEGVAVADYLARHGFQVTVTDRQPVARLGEHVQGLTGLGVSLVLGDHPVSLLDDADILFVSPGVPLEIPFLEDARSRNIPLCTETKLFCLLCPAPIVGITGSNGKTTTTTLVGKMLEADGRKCWVGGNIGRPLIEVVDQIKADEVVVMELSSFQLEYFHASLNKTVDPDSMTGVDRTALGDLLGNWSPAVSAILNITPNHLDRHPTMKHYVSAKRAVINYQRPDEPLVMNLDNDMTRTIGAQFGAKTRWFSLEAQMPGGACLIDNYMAFFDSEDEVTHIVPVAEVKLRGRHNLSNSLAACLLAREVGVSTAAMRQVLTTFVGVEHRLQFVRELKGVAYFNDSISTSPERLSAGLLAFKEPVILLAGGYDKKLPWDDAARTIIHKTRQVFLFGPSAPLIDAAIKRVRPDIKSTDTEVHHCETMADALTGASQIARPGEVVLLSPGCASFDAFRNYMERGQIFIDLVSRL